MRNIIFSTALATLLAEPRINSGGGTCYEGGLLVCGVLSSPALYRNDYLRCEAVGRLQLHFANHQRAVGNRRSH